MIQTDMALAIVESEDRLPAESLRRSVFIKQGKANKDGQSSVRMRMLPITSKEGESLASVTGLKGAALKIETSKYRAQLKSWLVEQVAKVACDPTWTFDGIGKNASGKRLNFGFRQEAAVVVKSEPRKLTDAEFAKLCAEHGYVKAPMV